MKTIGFLLCLALTADRAGAVEFRFRPAETTGLNSFLYDRDGKETAVQFAGDSNAEAVALLNALLEKQIYGTKDVERRRGVRWEQAITLTGEFASGVKRSEGGRENQRQRNTGISESPGSF